MSTQCTNFFLFSCRGRLVQYGLKARTTFFASAISIFYYYVGILMAFNYVYFLNIKCNTRAYGILETVDSGLVLWTGPHWNRVDSALTKKTSFGQVCFGPGGGEGHFPDFCTRVGQRGL